MLLGDVDVVDEEELMETEDRADSPAPAAAGLSFASASASAASNGFLPPPPSLFAFTLRSGVSKSTSMRGPWATFPFEALPPAALADVLQELTLKPHSMVGGIKRFSEAVLSYELVPPAEEEGDHAPAQPEPKMKKKKAAKPAKLRGSLTSPPVAKGLPPGLGPGWKVRVPRAYFTERFGRPAADETSLGREVAGRVAFEGSLRDDRQRSFVARMVNTLVDLRQTIALGSAEPGCGKTVMFLYLWAKVLRRKCLVIVHGMPIVAQWVGAGRRFCPEARIGIIHQDLWQVRGRDLVVASSDTLASRAEQFGPALWEEFGVVCFDEAHHIMAGTFMRIYRTCMHARYCISLTGTPYRKDGLTPAMPFLTGPNAAFMKNTDTVHVRTIEFSGGAQSFVGFKFGPAAGKPNESAMISAMVEDGKRTHLLADVIRGCLVAGRKVLVLCARNDLREALRLLVVEALAGVECPHRVKRLRAAGAGTTSGAAASTPAAATPTPTPTPDSDQTPRKRSRAVPNHAAAEERHMRTAMDVYDALYMEPYRVVRSGPMERRTMLERLAKAEAKLSEAARARVMDCEGLPPKVVPELVEEEGDQPASWIESLNAGDDFTTRMNKQQARAILATYVMAREALDVPGLDTLILATPSSDVCQAVGRIRRTGRGAAGASSSAADSGGSGSILHVPCALVLDFVDKFNPFLQWASARQRYYRNERFQVSKVQVHSPKDPWEPLHPAPPAPRGPGNNFFGAGREYRRQQQRPVAYRLLSRNEFDDDEEDEER